MTWVTSPVGTGSNLLYSQAGTPTLDLRFAESKSLVDYISNQNLITFVRASVGSYFDATGAIQTASSGVARFDHNPLTLASRGLLIEESATNLLLNSTTLSTQNITTTAVSHTLSFYGSGTVTLSGTHSATVNGAGAFPTRTTSTFTPTAGTLTVTVTGTVQYAQIEAKAFATSWIPTTGSTVLRNADEAYITGADFTNRFTQDTGTLFFQGEPTMTAANGQPPLLMVAPNTTNIGPGRGLTRRASQGARLTTFGTPSDDIEVTEATLWNSGIRKVAATMAVNDTALIADGSVIGTDTSTLNPLNIVNTLQFGGPNFNNRAGCWINRAALWPLRLSNATMQTITT